MSNSIIPSFLPPPYDFTTEYDDTEEEEEYDDTEEEEEEYNKGSLALNVLYGVVLCLAFYRLMDSEVNVEFKFSVSKSKTNRKIA